MTIPLWLPWVFLLALAAATLPRPDSVLRTWGPAAIALVVAAWLAVDHFWVTQEELTAATVDAAAVVDGSVGGVTQDRIQIEVEDRLGRPVSVERETGDTGSGDTAEVSYNYDIRPANKGADDDGPATCVKVVELRVDPSSPAVTLATVTAEVGACK